MSGSEVGIIVRRAWLGLIAVLAIGACAAAPPPAARSAGITLSRSVCFGYCPDYTVTITSEGDVTYVGRRFVNVVGEQRSTVPREEVARLLARFDEIGFERLRDDYHAPVTDLPTYTLTLTRDGHSKTVVDYGGLSAGMPQAVRDLQDEVDRVAGTARWVLRDGQPVRSQPQR
jgi:hypothetical protein